MKLDYEPQPRQAIAHGSKARQILYGGAAGGGKQFLLATLVPTTTGLKEIGSIVPGDVVFSDDGTPTTVVGVSTPEYTHSYEVEFNTGEIIVADARHLWKTMTVVEREAASRRTDEFRARRRESRPSRAVAESQKPWVSQSIAEINRTREYEYLEPPGGKIRTTQEISDTIRARGRVNHSVAVPPPIQCVDADLPIEPYVFGLWLGDGYSNQGAIGMLEDDWSQINVDEHVYSRRLYVENRNQPFEVVTIKGLTTRLRKLGVRGDKRIPQIYLRASESQRLSLLQGIMDTDGTCDYRGQCEILLSKKDLLEDVHELICSLGIKATIRPKRVKGYGFSWRVKFVSEQPVFRLPRKLERQKTEGHRDTTKRRYITSVTPVGKNWMRCIQVADPGGMYLVGRSFIPTHNSRFLRMDMVRMCLANPGMDAYLFRRTYPELQKNHINKFRTELPQEIYRYNADQKRFEFHNGSAINCCYCEKETDVMRYQGAEIHYLGVDEAAHLTEYQLTYLRTRCRLGDWKPNVHFEGALPRIVYTSNPGGPGHSWLKMTFIDSAPRETLFSDETSAVARTGYPGHPSIFIPATMADNSYLEAEYEGQFTALAPELARALMEGDWDAVVGAACHNLSKERHMVRTFEPPRHWTRFQVIDWGTAAPFSVGWYCVSEGAALAAKRGYPERWLPEGAIIRYREWYGWDGPPNSAGKGHPNRGCRWPSQKVARQILHMERDEVMDFRVGDTEMWAQKDGPSVQETMSRATEGRLLLRQAKKDRKRNYTEIISRLAGNPRFNEDGEEEEDPMLFVTEDCAHFWRTVPQLQLDHLDPEKGPDTSQENHCLVGDTKILTKNGWVNIDSVPLGAYFLVMTRDGWEFAICLGCTKENAEVYEVRLADERKFAATGDHPILCGDGKYRRVDELTYDMYQDESWHNISKAKHIGFAGDTIRGGVSAFIGSCGSITTGLYRRVCTSIISTATALITAYRIWNCSNLLPICGNTQIRQSVLNTLDGIWKKECARRQSSGTDQRMGERGIPNRADKQQRCHLASRLSAWCAERKGSQKRELENTVQVRANKRLFAVKIQGITRLSKKESVYNLHVPGVNNFIINGGIVVHNCYDEVAYACASRPFVTTEDDRYMSEYAAEMAAARGEIMDPYATR